MESSTNSFVNGFRWMGKFKKASQFIETIQRGTRCHLDQELIPNHPIEKNARKKKEKKKAGGGGKSALLPSKLHAFSRWVLMRLHMYSWHACE